MNSTNQNDKDSRDYLALGVFVAVLCILAISVLYLVGTSKKRFSDQPEKTVFKWLDDHVNRAKNFAKQSKNTWLRKRKNKEAKKHLATGYKLYRRGIYRKALHEFDQAIKIDPNNFKAHFWRGRVHLKREQFDDAISDFKMVIKLKPDYVEAYDNLGWIHSRRDEYDQSIRYLTKAIELRPDSGWAYFTRGHCHFRKGDLENALKDTAASCGLGYQKACAAYENYRSKEAGS